MLRVKTADYDHPKYYLCTGASADPGKFLMLSSPTRIGSGRRGCDVGRYQMDGRLLPIPLNEDGLSEIDMMYVHFLEGREVRAGVDFGRIGRSAAANISNFLNVTHVKASFAQEEWNRILAVLAACADEDPDVERRRLLDSRRLRRLLEAHDTGSATLMAAGLGPKVLRKR